MRIINLEQRSEDWLKWRVKGIGSSDACIIYNGNHFGKTPLDLYYEKIGTPLVKEPKNKQESEEHKKQVSAMNRGSNLEPLAREKYEKLVGLQASPICCIHDQHEWLKASLDGWIDEYQIVLEIKCPNKFDHQSALDGYVPEKYLPQLDHELLVTGGKQVHYVSFGSYIFSNDQKFALVKYKRDQQRIDELLRKEINFWNNVQSRVPPVG